MSSSPDLEPFAMQEIANGSLRGVRKAAASRHALHRLSHERNPAATRSVAGLALPPPCPSVLLWRVRPYVSLWSACSEAAAFELSET